MAKKDLQAANKAKNDEFYTQLNDIQLELSHYKKILKIRLYYAIVMTLTKVIFLNILR